MAKHRLGAYLTPRERQVATLIIEGKTRNEIANALGMGKYDVNRYMRIIKIRCGVRPEMSLYDYFKDRVQT